MERVYGAEVMALFRQVKDTFDPDAVLNPGVKLPAGESGLGPFKVGAAAAPLPADIEAELRRIEVEGGYARARLEIADFGTS